MSIEPFTPGTRVRFAPEVDGYSAVGVVVRHARQHVSGQRRIVVRWDADERVPVARTCIVSSLRLRPITKETP